MLQLSCTLTRGMEWKSLLESTEKRKKNGDGFHKGNYQMRGQSQEMSEDFAMSINSEKTFDVSPKLV